MKGNQKGAKVLDLWLTFMKIGAFTFGGGYAMIPLIQREAVEKKKWITDDELLEVVAIAESTPGPIAINSATFIGYRVAGFFGSFAATLGVVLPSFVIISLIAMLLRGFADFPAVRYAFIGIRAGVLALIVKTFYTMLKKCPKKWLSYTIAALAFVLVAFLKVNVLLVIAGCAVIGLVSSFLPLAKEKGRAEK